MLLPGLLIKLSELYSYHKRISGMQPDLCYSSACRWLHSTVLEVDQVPGVGLLQVSQDFWQLTLM